MIRTTIELNEHNDSKLKKIANPSKNNSMMIVVITIVLTYMVLFTIISVFQGGYSIHIWDTGDRQATWNGIRRS